MKEKIKLIKTEKRKYNLPVPSRLKHLSNTDVQIKFIDGEFQYIPIRYTFGTFVRLTSDELSLIVDELKRLNK